MVTGKTEQEAMELFTTRQQKSFTVVEFNAGSLMSSAVIKDVQPQLYKLADSDNITKIVFDMSKVRDISSQFLGVIIAVHTKTSRRRGKLVLAGLNANINELMHLTRLDRVITIVPTLNDATERDWVLG